MDKNMMKLIKTGCLIFGGLIVILILIVSIGSCTSKNNPTPPEDGTSSSTGKELIVYKSDNGLCLEKSSSCNKIPFKIPVKTDESKILTIASNDLYLIYNDDSLYLYDVENKKSTKLEIENKYTTYNIIIESNKAIGVVYGTDKQTYYNLSNKKSYYSYDSIEKIKGPYLIGRDKTNNKSYLLDINTENILLNNELNSNYIVNKSNSFTLYEISNNNRYSIVTTDNKILFSDLIETNYSIDLNGYIYIRDNNIIKIYNKDGLFSRQVNFTGLYKDLILNYLVYVENNKLYLKDISKNSPIELGTWDNKYIYNYKSDYYKENTLFGNTEKLSGIYILVQKDNNVVTGKEYFYDIRNGNKKEYEISDYREALTIK